MKAKEQASQHLRDSSGKQEVEQLVIQIQQSDLQWSSSAVSIDLNTSPAVSVDAKSSPAVSVDIMTSPAVSVDIMPSSVVPALPAVPAMPALPAVLHLALLVEHAQDVSPLSIIGLLSTSEWM